MGTTWFTSIISALLLTLLLACGKSDPTSPGDTTPSSSSSYSSSSSLISDREDILYSDTLSVGEDSLTLTFSQAGPWFVYLGNFPAGTWLQFQGRSHDFSSLRITLSRELGSTVIPTLPDSTGEFLNWWTPPTDSNGHMNYALKEGGHYYLQIQGSAESQSRIHLYATAQPARFTSLSDTLDWQASSDSLHAFLPLTGGQEKYFLRFSSPAGHFLQMHAQGTNLSFLGIRELGGPAIDSGSSQLRTLLLPKDSTTWLLEVRTALPSFLTGPHAYFSMLLTSLQLDSGAYFNAAHTALRPGDTLRIIRRGNENSLFELQHEHFVQLGNLSSGDSLYIWYGTRGIVANQRSLRVLDSSGNIVDTLPSILGFFLDGVQPSYFRAPSSGRFILQYTSRGGYFTDSLNVQFSLLLQKPGSLSSWAVQPDSVRIHLGDTLHMRNMQLQFQPSTASSHTFWRVPRSQRAIINDASSAFSENDLLITPWVIARDTGSAILIAGSVADPRRRDTTVIRVVP